MRNPIHRVLSTLKHHEVKYLLMGGQACVYYGGVEFSRDTDVAILAGTDNLERLKEAMRELRAEVIAVPPLQLEYLRRGHAVHFRCRHPDASGMRLDAMSAMRGLPEFEVMWARRTTAEVDGLEVDVMALPDLVAAKKTQRDKDWPVIRRLVEANYVQFGDEQNSERVRFWLEDCRTPALLREVAARFPEAMETAAEKRPFLGRLAAMTDEEIEAALGEEEQRERMADKIYWKPLRSELERLRHSP